MASSDSQDPRSKARLSETAAMYYSARGFQISQTLNWLSPSVPIMSTINPDNAQLSALNPRALILVVERNPVVQRLERYFLEQAGYGVEFAADGRSALDRARELCPSIVVTEIMVPVLDGLSLCRILKSEPKTMNAQVLIFSHLHAEDRAREVGADAFLLKPVSEDLLIETVERLIASQIAKPKDKPEEISE